MLSDMTGISSCTSALDLQQLFLFGPAAVGQHDGLVSGDDHEL